MASRRLGRRSTSAVQLSARLPVLARGTHEREPLHLTNGRCSCHISESPKLVGTVRPVQDQPEGHPNGGGLPRRVADGIADRAVRGLVCPRSFGRGPRRARPLGEHGRAGVEGTVRRRTTPSRRRGAPLSRPAPGSQSKGTPTTRRCRRYWPVRAPGVGSGRLDRVW